MFLFVEPHPTLAEQLERIHGGGFASRGQSVKEEYGSRGHALATLLPTPQARLVQCAAVYAVPIDTVPINAPWREWVLANERVVRRSDRHVQTLFPFVDCQIDFFKDQHREEQGTC